MTDETLHVREGRSEVGIHRALVLCAASIAVALVAAASRSDPVFVWNATSSSPRGLYRVMDAVPGRGAFVIARLPFDTAALAHRRGYVPSGIPIVKSVAAGPGDRVCARGTQVTVNARLVAVRRPLDRFARALPWWSGCRRLRADQFFLIGRSHPASFDGRYFGPSSASDIVGPARLIWRD